MNNLVFVSVCVYFSVPVNIIILMLPDCGDMKFIYMHIYLALFLHARLESTLTASDSCFTAQANEEVSNGHGFWVDGRPVYDSSTLRFQGQE